MVLAVEVSNVIPVGSVEMEKNGGILTDRTSTVLILGRAVMDVRLFAAVNQVWRSTCVRMVIFNYAIRY